MGIGRNNHSILWFQDAEVYREEKEMKLTRAQELRLIDIGFRKVLEMLESPVIRKAVRKKKNGKKWSEKRKKAFAKTMKQKWAAQKS
jgi:hypothetical protein